MNRDTPGAVPSDDFPFLGPAVSPRRREAGSPLQDSSELAAPFVGGLFQRPAEEPAPAERSASQPSTAGEAEAGNPDQVRASADEEPLEDLPGSDWPSDDFPWLTPSAPESEDEPADEPWRATAEVEELTQGEGSYVIDEDADVEHLSWIGEPVSEAAAEPREAETYSAGAGGAVPGDEAGRETESAHGEAVEEDYAGFGWEGEPNVGAAPAETSSYSPDAAEDERVGFTVDSEAAEDSWPHSESWGAEAPAERGEAAGAAEWRAEQTTEAEPTSGRFPSEAEADADDRRTDSAARWDRGEGFRVDEREAEMPAAAAPSEPPVDAAPLPVGEWEEATAAGEVEEVESEGSSGTGAAAGAPLDEVADRLERIARSLRSGTPVEALQEGDPLQLLITGYALGYSQARKGRG